MARIIGAVATSHFPTIGFAPDGHKENDPAWAPIFKAYEPVQRWLKENKPDVLFEEFGLTSEERDLVRRRDWRGMIQYGVIFFMLEKLGAVVGVSNLHICVAICGESLEEFLKTRNQPGALYSVAGKDAKKLEWEKTAAGKLS